MFCSKCGSRLSGGGNFCYNCGSRVINTQSAETSHVNPAVDIINGGVEPIPEVITVGEAQVKISSAAIMDLIKADENPWEEDTAGNIPEPPASDSPSRFGRVHNRPEEASDVISLVPENPGKPEKAYFGKPALVFCLILIGLLSVINGVLAMLYFGDIQIW